MGDVAETMIRDLCNEDRWERSHLVMHYLATDINRDEAQVLAAPGAARDALETILRARRQTDAAIAGLLMFVMHGPRFSGVIELHADGDGFDWRDLRPAPGDLISQKG